MADLDLDEDEPSPGNELSAPMRARATRVVEDPRSLARLHTQLAVSTLADVCENGGHRERVAAAVAILDRAWGRPVESVEHSGPNGAPIQQATAQLDLSRLSGEELRMMLDLTLKARGEARD